MNKKSPSPPLNVKTQFDKTPKKGDSKPMSKQNSKQTGKLAAPPVLSEHDLLASIVSEKVAPVAHPTFKDKNPCVDSLGVAFKVV